MSTLYEKLVANPTVADIHITGQGSVGNAYRIGLSGKECSRFIIKNGSECHQAWRAGRDIFRKGGVK